MFCSDLLIDDFRYFPPLVDRTLDSFLRGGVVHNIQNRRGARAEGGRGSPRPPGASRGRLNAPAADVVSDVLQRHPALFRGVADVR